MPIQGVTTQRRLPRLGKIRTGVKAVSSGGREYPRAVDYFVCPAEVQQVYGERPKTLDIMLPVDGDEVIAPAYYKAYSFSRGLVCKGDGINANRLIDSARKGAEPGTGVATGPIADKGATETEWLTGITCPGRDCEYYVGSRCREVMSLQFLLPSVPGLGVWQLDTGSYHSIVNVYSCLELIRGMFGTAAMIPLQLSLEPQEVSPDGLKKTVHVLHLRNGSTFAEIAASKGQPLAASMVPAPDDGRGEDLVVSLPEVAAAIEEKEHVPPKPPLWRLAAWERRLSDETDPLVASMDWTRFRGILDNLGVSEQQAAGLLGITGDVAEGIPRIGWTYLRAAQGLLVALKEGKDG